MPERPRRVWAVIAGGGTSGHVVPALAVADAIVTAGRRPDEIHFVGSARGIEATLVPDAGYAVTLLPGRGIPRRVSPTVVVAVVGLLTAVARAVALIRRLRPAVVLVVGGYASFPCAVAARLWRVPLVVAEQNAQPGLANRFAARGAAACAVAFEGTPLPRAVVTGNPVRPAVAAVDRRADRDRSREALGVPLDRRVLLAVGGSLGARTINDAVVGALDRWRDRDDLAVVHLAGRRGIGEVGDPGDTGRLWYRVSAYESRMDLAYASADLAVARAGAGTVFELAAVALPAVLVPFPGATGDHQTRNAEAAVSAGGAVLVPDAEMSAERLIAEVEPLLADDAALDRMAAGIATMARPDAAGDVAALMGLHARGDR